MDKNLQSYYAQIKKIPLLSFEEELALSRQIQQGDEAARKRLIEANLRLVVKIAQGYKTADVPFMDIVQEGNLALIHAAEKYDHRRQVRFSTYAAWWIRQFIARFLSAKRRTIRLPLRKEQLLRRAQRSYHILSQRLMRKPSNREIAADIGASEAEVDSLFRMSSAPVSLDVKAGSDESITLADIQEDYTYSPERNLMKKSSRAAAIHFMDHLKEREKRILLYRYQFNDNETHTLKNIGDKMGLSAETVRQIEIRALAKMRTSAEELRGCVYVEAM
ncbi:MAG: RNA polymerase sigma factor RpoD/SigA [Treponema sp.]|jgi:RNA polymerase primary sigma factor|nr:RNA polymerase sigma factor RpoD/SigA [Treponema sp.]